MKQNRNMLGIVFYEQTIAVTEVENAGGAVHIRRNAEFLLPEGVTLENAASVQAQFGAFLIHSVVPGQELLKSRC